MVLFFVWWKRRNGYGKHFVTLISHSQNLQFAAQLEAVSLGTFLRDIIFRCLSSHWKSMLNVYDGGDCTKYDNEKHSWEMTWCIYYTAWLIKMVIISALLLYWSRIKSKATKATWFSSSDYKSLIYFETAHWPNSMWKYMRLVLKAIRSNCSILPCKAA